MAFTIVTQGSFVSTGANTQILLPSSADYFVTTNLTQMPLAPATAVVIRGEWYRGLTAVNDGIRWKKTNSTNAINIDTFGTATASNGFTYVPVPPQPEAAVTGTAITAATPAVVASTNTYSEGDYVTLYGTTGMLQISGMTFQISSVSGSGYTLKGLPAVGFAAAATALISRRVSKTMPVEPRTMYVTAISKATSAVITLSESPSYVTGQLVHFSVPSTFGMTEMNQLTGRITAVDTTNYTVTVNIDSSAFTTFAFPASTASPTATLFATMSPAGQQVIRDPNTFAQVGYNTSYAPFHTGQFVPYMLVAGGAQSPGGAASDVIVYQAYKMENS